MPKSPSTNSSTPKGMQVQASSQVHPGSILKLLDTSKKNCQACLVKMVEDMVMMVCRKVRIVGDLPFFVCVLPS